MALQGIDISNWQNGIKLSKLDGIDFAIVKATQGTDYTSPSFASQMKDAATSGLLRGRYHYISGAGAAKEMRHFYDVAGKSAYKDAIVCLDWESDQNSKWGTPSYLEECVKECIALFGVKPLIYVSKSFMANAVKIAEKHDCGLWIAQYASNNQTGLQANPWNEGVYACAIRQYSSNGRLDGYNGALDLNKFYGNKEAWKKYAARNTDDSSEINSDELSNGTYKISGTITIEKID